MSFRQNLDPLVDGDLVNPTKRFQWGYTLPGTSVQTERSAVCVHASGHLVYGWGDDLNGTTLAKALRELYRVSGGVPRLINVIADRALLGGYTQDSHEISAAMVRRAASEVFGRRLLPRWIPITLGTADLPMKYARQGGGEAGQPGQAGQPGGGGQDQRPVMAGQQPVDEPPRRPPTAQGASRRSM